MREAKKSPAVFPAACARTYCEERLLIGEMKEKHVPLFIYARLALDLYAAS